MPDILSIAILIGVVVLLSGLLTWWLTHPNAPIKMLDQPNERSLHTEPTPRTGGVAICVSLLLAWLAATAITDASLFPLNILIGAIIIAAIAIFDDRHNLSAALRLLVQLSAAIMMVMGGFVVTGELLPGTVFTASSLVITLTTVLLTLWLTNLYNFMDGMDGFAAGMAVIGFGALGLLGGLQGDTLFAGSALLISAAAADFLYFNFPPARIFMGDSGSTTLGFLVAAFVIWASRRGIAPVWLSLVIFSPFVVDASVTLLKRALRGEAVWRAHRSHYYQRLVQLGWGHRRTVLAEYAAMLICAIMAVSLRTATLQTQWVMLLALAIAYSVAAIVIHRQEHTQDARREN